MDIKKNQIIFFQNNLLKWYRKNKRKFPWRKSNLSNYKLVIAEVLLQRTKAETINQFYPKFLEKYPSWISISEQEIYILEEDLKPIGLYKQRAPRMKALADEMVKRNGRFPENREELETIPFVGQYIANAILLLCKNIPQPLMDVNMARVLERYFGPRKLSDIRYDPYLHDIANKIVKHEKSKTLNWSILDFAAIVCKKLKPRCKICDLKNKCKHYN